MKGGYIRRLVRTIQPLITGFSQGNMIRKFADGVPPIDMDT